MTVPERERVAPGSLLDRLIDESPKDPEDPPPTLARSVQRARAGVMRDLEWLLNTRRTPDPAPESLVEVRRSLYHYGLPDTTSLGRDDPAVRRYLQRELEECLRVFEPRLSAVAIRLVQETGPLHRLRFIVDAILQIDPEPERIRFDTVLDVTSGRISVGGSEGA